MKIIIVGAGAVGSILATKLSAEAHDVTLVERDEQRVHTAQQSLDALCVEGNGAAIRTLKKIGAPKAQVFIAVTDHDEVNILACLAAKSLGVKETIARVRNTDYFNEDGSGNFDGIDTMLNPDQEAVTEIHELLMKQAATEFLEYADGRVQVIGARVGEGSAVVGRSLNQLEAEVGRRWALVAAITRAGKTIIPRGEDVLEVGDHVFLVGRRGRISKALNFLSEGERRVENVMISGANRIGIALARRLASEGIHVKLIDSSLERTQKASHVLDHVLVLHGEATDLEMLRSEGLADMDGFIAASGDEELNLTSSLMARQESSGKTICLIKQPNYVPLASNIGIHAAVSPRLALAQAIMRHFRRGKLLSQISLSDNDAEILELEATESSPVSGRRLADMKFPPQVLIAAIIKPYQVVVPRGSDIIEAGDKVLVFAVPSSVHAVQKLF